MKTICFLLLVAFTTTTSCKVSFVPAFDASVVQAVKDGSKLTNLFYQKMAVSDDKSFAAFSEDYNSLESQINSIMLKEKARSKSASLVKITENLKDTFLKYKSEHEVASSLNLSQIQLYNQYLQALWKPLLVAEQGLK